MKILTSILIALTIATTTSLIAGDNHSHDDDHHGHSHAITPVNKTTAEKNAVKVLNSFIEKKVLKKSWENVDVNSSSIKVFDGKEEWLVTFKNDKAEDKKKQTLFMFLTLSGKYIAANFTGE